MNSRIGLTMFFTFTLFCGFAMEVHSCFERVREIFWGGVGMVLGYDVEVVMCVFALALATQ